MVDAVPLQTIMGTTIMADIAQSQTIMAAVVGGKIGKIDFK